MNRLCPSCIRADVLTHNVGDVHRTSSLVCGFVRRWSREPRAGVSNLPWDAQAVWCADSSYSRVLAAQTTRQHVCHSVMWYNDKVHKMENKHESLGNEIWSRNWAKQGTGNASARWSWDRQTHADKLQTV